MSSSHATAAQPRPASRSESIPAKKNSPLLYGLGSFGLESTYKVFWGFYLFFYVDVLGLAVALAAIINVVYAIWDALNDPLVGYLSDNTRTRWGRRREGLYYSLLRVFGRLSKILEALALVLLGVLFGYISGENPRPRPADAFRFLISVIPFAFMTFAWLIAQDPFWGNAMSGVGAMADTTPAFPRDREAFFEWLRLDLYIPVRVCPY